MAAFISDIEKMEEEERIAANYSNCTALEPRGSTALATTSSLVPITSYPPLAPYSAQPTAYIATSKDPIGRHWIDMADQRSANRAKYEIMRYTRDVLARIGVRDADNVLLYCRYCNVMTNSKEQKAIHIAGEPHRLRLEELVAADAADMKCSKCAVCEIDTQGMKEAHVKTTGHLEKAKKFIEERCTLRGAEEVHTAWKSGALSRLGPKLESEEQEAVTPSARPQRTLKRLSSNKPVKSPTDLRHTIGRNNFSNQQFKEEPQQGSSFTYNDLDAVSPGISQRGVYSSIFSAFRKN